MLNNLSNFFNLIVGRKIKTTAADSDLIPLGTRDPRYDGFYQPTGIQYADLKADILSNVTVSGCLPQFDFKAGSVGEKVSFKKSHTDDPTVVKDVIIPGQLEITRGNAGGGIYNIAYQINYSGGGPQYTFWNTQYLDANDTSWAPLGNIDSRIYDTWLNAIQTPAGSNAPPQYVGMPAIMKFDNGADPVRYWLILFTEWGVGNYNEEGAFAYDRWEIYPSVTYIKADYDNTAVDTISAGVHIKRDNNGPLYNSVTDPFGEAGASPRNTRWNSVYTDSRSGYSGFSDLSNLEDRVYTDFTLALDYAIGNNVLTTDLIMHDMTTDLYYKVVFTSWTQNGNGGGFAYTRTVIPQSCPIKFADGSVMTSAAKGSGGVQSVTYANVFFVDSTNPNYPGIQNRFDKPFATVNDALSAASALTPTQFNRVLIYVRRGSYSEYLVQLKNYVDIYCEPGVVFDSTCFYDAGVTIDTRFMGKACFYGYGNALGGIFYRVTGAGTNAYFEFDEAYVNTGFLETGASANLVLSARKIFSETLYKGFGITLRGSGKIVLNVSENISAWHQTILFRSFSGKCTINCPRLTIETGNYYGNNNKQVIICADFNSGGECTVNGDFYNNDTAGYWGGISGMITRWTATDNMTLRINGNIYAGDYWAYYALASTSLSKTIITGDITTNHLIGYAANSAELVVRNGSLINYKTYPAAATYPVASMGGSAKVYFENCVAYGYGTTTGFTYKDSTASTLVISNVIFSNADGTGFFVKNTVGGTPVNNVRIHSSRSQVPLDTNIVDLLSPTGFIADANTLTPNFL